MFEILIDLLKGNDNRRAIMTEILWVDGKMGLEKDKARFEGEEEIG